MQKEFVPGATDEVDLLLHELIGEQNDRVCKPSIATAECFACDTTIQTDYALSGIVRCKCSCSRGQSWLGSSAGITFSIGDAKRDGLFYAVASSSDGQGFHRVFSDVQRRGLKCTQVVEQLKSLHISLQEQVKGSVVLPSADMLLTCMTTT